MANEERMSMEQPMERSTLQVLLSGRIIITGILNEILFCLPEEKEQSEFVIESECSLMMDSEARAAMKEYSRGVNLLTLLASSEQSLEEVCKQSQNIGEPSLYSLYKESQGTGEYNSFVNGQNSYQERKSKISNTAAQTKAKEKQPSLSRPKSVDFSRYASSTWKGLSMLPDSAKSSKSVTFTSTEAENQAADVDPSGMFIEARPESEIEREEKKPIRSLSTKLPWPNRGRVSSGGSIEDMDLWLKFLIETGIMQASDQMASCSEHISKHDSRVDDPSLIIKQMEYYRKSVCESFTTSVRDEYESINRLCPGLFWDTVMTDDEDEAFNKLKRLIKDIVNRQSKLKPMFDIDFSNMDHYPTVKNKLDNICQQIAPQKLFY